MKIWLGPTEPTDSEYTWAKTTPEAIDILKDKYVRILSLENATFLDVLDYITENFISWWYDGRVPVVTTGWIPSQEELDKLYSVNMKRLWLDDQRGPYFEPWVEDKAKDWLWVSTVEQVILMLDAGRVTHLHLDYDLSYSDPRSTGMDVLDYIAEHKPSPLPEMFVHSGHSKLAGEMWKRIEEIEKATKC